MFFNYFFLYIFFNVKLLNGITNLLKHYCSKVWGQYIFFQTFNIFKVALFNQKYCKKYEYIFFFFIKN